MIINGKNLVIKNIKQELLEKTTFSEKGLNNVFKSMASEFLTEKKNFLVRIADKDVLHISSQQNGDDVIVELKDIIDDSDFYINSGVLTENITRKNIGLLN